MPHSIELSELKPTPSTAKCNLDIYTLFLLSEPKYPGCKRLAEILEGLSHDSVNRFLLRERYNPKDLFNEVKGQIDLIGGTLLLSRCKIEKRVRSHHESNSSPSISAF